MLWGCVTQTYSWFITKKGLIQEFLLKGSHLCTQMNSLVSTLPHHYKTETCSQPLAVMFHAVDDTYIRPSCEAAVSCAYVCIQLFKAVENLNKFFSLIHIFREGLGPLPPPPESSQHSSEIACCINSIGHNVVAICATLFCYQEPKTSCLLYTYVTTKWLICYYYLGTSIYYFHFCHLKDWQHRWFELIFGDSKTQSTMSLKKCYLQVKLSIYSH